MKTSNGVKKISTLWWIGGALILIAILLGWSKWLQSSDPNVIAQNGLHWHPRLSITVKGAEVPIPPNIGVGPQYAGMPTFDASMKMAAMHTHEDMPVIHLEFPGLVREKDIVLGNFFQIWGKDMGSFGNNVRMVVNGKESTEYENYVMRDGDRIELTFE